MNRGRSSDSLANSDAGLMGSSSGSSSPTDFTSDDEVNADNLYIMSGQTMYDSRSRFSMNSAQTAKNDKYQSSRNIRSDYPLQPRHMIQTSARPVLSSNQRHLSNQLDFIDESNVEPQMNASTSYCEESTALPSHRLNTPNLLSDLLSSGMSDVLPSQSSTTHLPGQPFGNRCGNHKPFASRDLRSVNRNRRNHLRMTYMNEAHSSNAIDRENGENFSVDLGDDVDPSLFGREAQLEHPSLPTLAASSRGLNTIAVRMCSRLVECRSLLECIEFIEDNRELIDNVTRIITQEAPAFRNYDLNSYQIDYSVKESFNPNFWLDREPIVTTADGNCQYHAISLSLTGTEAYTPEVRLATAVAVVDNREWFDSMLKLIDRGSILDLIRTIARSYSWGDETTLKAIAVAINRRIFLYTCNIGKKDYEMVKSLSKDELLDAFKEKKYRGGTGIHTYADPLIHVPANNYIMLFHKSEHFIAVLPTNQQPTMFEPYNPIVPVFE